MRKFSAFSETNASRRACYVRSVITAAVAGVLVSGGAGAFWTGFEA